MEGGIDLPIENAIARGEVPLLQEGLTVLKGLLDDRALLRGQAELRRAPRSQSFQGSTDLVCLYDVVDRVGAHVITAVGDVIQ